MSEPKLIGYIGRIRVAVQIDPAVAHGHQRILLSPAGGGAFMAAVLDPDFEHRDPAEVFQFSPGWIAIPHSSDVDERLIQLVDVCAEIRRQAPLLTQLSFTEEG